MGHNLWDGHYLKAKPVHDLSLEMEGRIALDGHFFADTQREGFNKKTSTIRGKIMEKVPASMPFASKNRMTISEFPAGKAEEYPPFYKLSSCYNPLCNKKVEGNIKIISLGRLGTMMDISNPNLYEDRPSDDAFVAMIDSANSMIRLALQDIGPFCFPGTKRAMPGCTWPENYLSALARVIWKKSVDVELVLSNPRSIPNDLSPTEAIYGNGWSCNDVASEIIKRIKKQFPHAKDDELRQKVNDNLRVCFIRQKQGPHYADGTTIGLHSKHFIVDDICCYIGSQNLYVCDLAEWGVVIDDEVQVKQILQEYWEPMWASSFTGEDCDVDEVMDGLEIERDGEDVDYIDQETQKLINQVGRLGAGNSTFYSEED